MKNYIVWAYRMYESKYFWIAGLVAICGHMFLMITYPNPWIIFYGVSVMFITIVFLVLWKIDYNKIKKYKHKR